MNFGGRIKLMNKLTIATRKSKLAQTQTEIIMKSLKDKFNIDSEKMLIVTEEIEN